MMASIFDNELVPQSIKDAMCFLDNFIKTDDDKQLENLALNIVTAFGNNDPAVCTGICSYENEKKLITSFMKNMQLLVQKTWVEEAEEEFKDETLYRINSLCQKLINANDKSIYKTNFKECFLILHDTILLLFGNLVNTENFLDYAIRIDPSFGFFWYYIDLIGKLENVSIEKARYSVLLAMFFLANF